MIHRVGKMSSFTIAATDGEVGKVRDLYFDDAHWAIRYLIVETGGWLLGRDVLISPFAVRMIEWAKERITVALTREQVRNSPDVDTGQPVTRQREAEHLAYYGYPDYWTGPAMWGAMTYPVPVPNSRRTVDEAAAKHPVERASHAHLRSVREVSGYRIEATDGRIGHVEDFLFDPQSWGIRYVLVETRNVLPGKHVLIAPKWIDRVSWSERFAYVHVTRRAVKESPEFDPSVPLGREYEASLLRHYHRSHRP